MNHLLDIRNLHVHFNTYAGRIQAVRDISFSIKAGEIVGLVGESGCGKSVTAQSILKLNVDRSTAISGHIFFEDEDLLAKTEKEMQHIRGKQISMIFQDPATSLNPTLKIGYQIVECLQTHEKLSKTEASTKAIELLNQVGIQQAAHRFYQYPHELSGGMKQRVLIAMALACDPKLIIADEPTTALDVTTQAQILNLLKDIQQQKQLSLLLISHDLGVVAHMCDRVVIMYAGKIVEAGTIQEVFSHPRHPYTRALIQSKQILNKKIGKLQPIPGYPPDLLHPPIGCTFAPRCIHAQANCQKESPPLIQLSSTHQTACWLNSEGSHA